MRNIIPVIGENIDEFEHYASTIETIYSFGFFVCNDLDITLPSETFYVFDDNVLLLEILPSFSYLSYPWRITEDFNLPKELNVYEYYGKIIVIKDLYKYDLDEVVDFDKYIKIIEDANNTCKKSQY